MAPHHYPSPPDLLVIDCLFVETLHLGPWAGEWISHTSGSAGPLAASRCDSGRRQARGSSLGGPLRKGEITSGTGLWHGLIEELSGTRRPSGRSS